VFVFFSSLFVVYCYYVLDVFNTFGLYFCFPSYVRYDLPLLYFLVLFFVIFILFGLCKWILFCVCFFLGWDVGVLLEFV